MDIKNVEVGVVLTLLAVLTVVSLLQLVIKETTNVYLIFIGCKEHIKRRVSRWKGKGS